MRLVKSTSCMLIVSIFLAVLPALGFIVYSTITNRAAAFDRAQDNGLAILNNIAARQQLLIESNFARQEDLKQTNTSIQTNNHQTTNLETILLHARKTYIKEALPPSAYFVALEANGAVAFSGMDDEDIETNKIPAQNIKNLPRVDINAAWDFIGSQMQQEGAGTFTGSNGSNFFIVYKHMHLAGMEKAYVCLVLLYPEGEIYTNATVTLIYNLMLWAFFVIVCGALAWQINKRLITAPIATLIKTANDLAAEENINDPLPAQHGSMGDLINSFQEIAHTAALHEQELRQSKQLADESNATKSEFLSNIGQEIRTPMNTIIGMAYITLKTDLSEKQRGYISKIYGAANTLLGIINDVLDFSKIESGQLAIENTEFKLDDILENVAALMGRRAEEKNLDLLFGVDPNVPQALLGDPLRLSQILTNLLSNAVKFTESGNIIVSCILDAIEADRIRLCFTVQDTGIGMTQEQLGKLFIAFRQADGSITRRFGGIGLGLTIAKRLIELMDGDISIASEIGQGTMVIFTVTLGLAADKGIEQEQTEDFERILIVDDNKQAGHILQNILTNMQFRAETVENLNDAFNMLCREDEKDPYKIVLMDWRMPIMDGIEAAWHIRTELFLTNDPVVFITAPTGHAEVPQQAKKVGAAGVLYKPINKSHLFHSIMHALHEESPEDNSTTQASSDLAKDIETPNLCGISILLAEDNPINQEVVLELLAKTGAIVTTARNGLQVLDKIEQSKNTPPFDLILMDLSMPEMDGLEAAKTIRNDGQKNDMPIIAMLAHALTDEREQYLAAGINDHIAKPIEASNLYSTLCRWLGSNKNNQTSYVEMGDQKAGWRLVLPRADVPQETLYLPGLDVQNALSKLGYSDQIYIKLLEQFLKHYPDTEARLQIVLAEGNFTEAQRLTRTLKGMAGAIGAVEAADKTAELEASFNDKHPVTIRLLAEECFRAMRQIEEMLQTAFEQQEKADEFTAVPQEEQKKLSAEEREKLQPLLNTLEKLLEDCDAEASSCLTLHTSELTAILSPQVIKDLQSLLSRFEFDEALELLKTARIEA